MVPSAYVHIPFCDSICAYCDFVRIQKNEQFFSLWKEKLIQEIQEYKISNLHTLYFGGGTPSVLSLDDFASIRNCFPKDIDEFTVECNPESLDEEKLASYVSLGVNRISLGVQSFNDDLLKVCRRRHTSNQAKNVIRWIQESGIHNFSIDLIFGLPNQTMEDVKRDISTFLSLDIPHLSIYSLQIEENSIFGKTGVEPIDSDLEADMFEYITKTLEAAGYNYDEVQAKVNEILGVDATPKKSVDEIAQEVINGAWGNGQDRKNRIEQAGYDYTAVQNKVNELCGTPKKSIDEIARAVIRGEYGNGADRKNRITAEGYDYAAVQARVNDLM